MLNEYIANNQKIEEEKAKINLDIKKASGLFTKVNASEENFGRCENFKFFPKSKGVAQVKRTLDKIYLLTNNQVITFGDCTQHQTAKPGHFISWTGYLMKGIVNALAIKTIQ